MKSLKEFIFELNDQTYLNAAKKLYTTNKEKSLKLIKHSHNVLIKNFLNDISKCNWFDDNCKLVFNNYADEYDLVFNNIDNVDKIDKNIVKDVDEICKQHNRLIHGMKLTSGYIDEKYCAFIRFYFLHRDPIDKLKSNTKLYHITNESNIESIRQNGLKPSISSKWNFNYYYRYYFNALFALKSKKDVKKMSKILKSKENLYLVVFEAGDNLWFYDRLQNSGGDMETAIYTTDEVDAFVCYDITRNVIFLVENNMQKTISLRYNPTINNQSKSVRMADDYIFSIDKLKCIAQHVKNKYV